jgi:hypothetical protein
VKKITLTTRNVAALKKKYPITFRKLNERLGTPADEAIDDMSGKTLLAQIPYYNDWLASRGYDNDEWFNTRNMTMETW